MLKRVLFVLVFLFCISLFRAEAYTVIFKSGKIMTGTLISETADTIIFKDDKGFQFSLKKTSLDLEKMTEANAVKPAAPVLQETDITSAPRSKGRIYTKEDLDKLKEKYGDLTTGEPIEDPQDFEGGVLKPDAFLQLLKRGATQATEAIQDLATLSNGVASAWEVSESTGRDPAEAIKSHLEAESTVALLQTTTSEVNSVVRLQETLSTQIPQGYADGYKMLSDMVAALQSYQGLISNYASIQNASLYRSRVNELSGQIGDFASRLQTFQPPAPKKPEKKTPGEEKPSTGTAQTTEPPSQ